MSYLVHFSQLFLLSVIQALVLLINEPEPEHPLRGDLAEEYTKNKKAFFQKAADFTKKHAAQRPPE